MAVKALTRLGVGMWLCHLTQLKTPVKWLPCVSVLFSSENKKSWIDD